MARVYFHMFDGTRLFRDDVGMELPPGKALIDEAYAHIGEVRVSQPNNQQWSAWRMIVTDEAGQTLLHMTFDFELISQRGG